MRASFRRDTAETEIEVSLDLEGSGSVDAKTGVPLLDEILKILARASGFDIEVRARGVVHFRLGDGGIACGIELNGDVLAQSHRRHVVLHGHCSSAASCIPLNIGDSERYRVGAHIAAVEGALAY